MWSSTRSLRGFLSLTQPPTNLRISLLDGWLADTIHLEGDLTGGVVAVQYEAPEAVSLLLLHHVREIPDSNPNISWCRLVLAVQDRLGQDPCSRLVA